MNKTEQMLAPIQSQCSIFLNSKSIQTTVESSIVLALSASELNTEMLFKTPDSMEEPNKSQNLTSNAHYS